MAIGMCNGGRGVEEREKKNTNHGGDVNIIFRINLHCHGCTSKIRKTVLKFPGVRRVNFEGDDTVNVFGSGSVAIEELRNKIEKKTGKLVKLVSPQPKKEIVNKKKNNGMECKQKEPQVTTVVLKVAWHCNGCGERIHKAVSSFKGVYEVEIDRDKDLVRVKGIMDTKKLVNELARKLKRPVEIVPPKKEKGGGGREDKAQAGGSGGGGGGGSGSSGGKGGENVCNCRVHPYTAGSGYGDWYPGQMLDPFRFDTPQLFSDENANGCSIM